MSRRGEKLALPVRGPGGAEATCPSSGERYRLQGGELVLVAEPG
jgi:UDP-2-acetamido-3-amino-2,3-dideoxy-glucuronate N-acetyltransferase